MTMTTSGLVGSLLTDEMLAAFDERAPLYDRETRFFTEDFDDLRASGYLLAAVPTEFGGFGLSLAELAPMQRRLAYHAPATAVADPPVQTTQSMDPVFVEQQALRLLQQSLGAEKIGEVAP